MEVCHLAICTAAKKHTRNASYKNWNDIKYQYVPCIPNNIHIWMRLLPASSEQQAIACALNAMSAVVNIIWYSHESCAFGYQRVRRRYHFDLRTHIAHGFFAMQDQHQSRLNASVFFSAVRPATSTRRVGSKFTPTISNRTLHSILYFVL